MPRSPLESVTESATGELPQAEPAERTPPPGSTAPRPAYERIETAPRSHLSPVAPSPTPDWEALEPRGLYARLAKPLLRGLLLVVSLPPALLVGIPIALVNAILFRSVRKVFYRQPRVGYRGRIFTIIKFRTLRDGEGGDFDSWSDGDDVTRVTRFGHFLRTTHLDELPQLWNILRGEMDFIGPRPEMVEIDRWARARIPSFRERNALLPGVTGYAQVTHGYAPKDPAAYARKLWADQHYRRSVSLALDLRILSRTLVWMVRGRGWGLARRVTSEE